MKYSRHNNGSNGGFSLIELTLVIVLMAVLAGFAFQGILGAVSVYVTSSRGYLMVYQEGKIALEKMVREIRETSPGNLSVGAGSISFTKHTDHVTPLDSNLFVTFVQSGDENTIKRQTGAGNYVLAGNVVSNSFTTVRDGNDVVTISFNVYDGGNQYLLRTSVWPRQP